MPWVKRGDSAILPVPEQPDCKPLQVLRRSDGMLILYDDRRQLGRRTVKTWRPNELQTAVDFMRREHARATQAR